MGWSLDQLLDLVTLPLVAEPGESGVVHNLLAYLATAGLAYT